MNYLRRRVQFHLTYGNLNDFKHLIKRSRSTGLRFAH